MPVAAQVRGGRLVGSQDRPRLLRLLGRRAAACHLSQASDLVEVALAVVVRDGRVLVAPREPGVHLEGLWEFPGGKLEPEEEPAAAAARELREETGLVAPALEPLTVFHHAYPDRNLKLHVFVGREVEGEPAAGGGREWSWMTLSQLEALPLPPANQAILRALRWRLGPRT